LKYNADFDCPDSESKFEVPYLTQNSKFGYLKFISKKNPGNE